jgi:protein-disulfide isomerase
MRPLWIGGLAAIAGAAAGVVGSAAASEVTDKVAVEKIVHDYLLAHPEILTEAMGKLQERQAATAIQAERGAIETPFAGAWAGAEHPRVTLVMFSDYSCIYCHKSAPDIERLLAEVPDLKVVWREIPVLGPQSVVAARAALEAAREGKYLAFHRALFASARPDDATIAAAARKVGLDPAKLSAGGKGDDVTKEIGDNLHLAAKIGVDGTPAFVIGDQMLSGAVGYDALRKAVDKARAAA